MLFSAQTIIKSIDYNTAFNYNLTKTSLTVNI